MQPDLVMSASTRPGIGKPFALVGLVWLAIVAVTFQDWAAMAHQWWNIDTYSHILLVPPIILWLIYIRVGEVRKVAAGGWWGGIAVTAVGLCMWFAGRNTDINLVAQCGAVVALQGAALGVLGLRAGVILAFPLGYMLFLVPFGDEIIPPLQFLTAEMVTALTRWSGVETVADGINIDTPAGLFIVAEECAGVKFLIAMLTLGILVAQTCFASWKRRAWFLLACIVVPILANAVRAWATIYIAQYVGAEAAGSFDHIVYGWIFFGIVIAIVLGIAWRFFEREPEEAGWTADEVAGMSLVTQLQGKPADPAIVCGAVIAVTLAFAVILRLV